ncbi:MAG: esterase-like activity of phytase family protein [Pseudomonadota bacterium]
MHRLRSVALGFALTTALTAPSVAAEQVPAILAGHAYIPAMTMVPPPADAPRNAWISGKFARGDRNDEPMTLMGKTGRLHGERETGIRLPFLGQPLQGFSGFAMKPAADGSVYALIDNGFGSKVNSPDALLFFTRIQPDWAAGSVHVLETVFLHDPDRVIPFQLVNEATDERYLTGGDFDPESIQVVGDAVWIGEEFGPYLIRATLDGRVTGVFPTMLEGTELRSPDHPRLRVPAVAGEDFVVPRSGGYEGMALTPDETRLWGMIEKPLLGADGQPEGRFLRVLEFDPAAAEWTGNAFNYPLEEGATAIGDFNFIDDTRALVIERDNGEGDPSLACADATAPQPDCFPHPARFKRVYLIDTASIDAEGFVQKVAFVDLMDIEDPKGLARLETAAAEGVMDGRFTLPFFTIEDVRMVDERHIMVGVDNNLPFSSGRALDRAADNEFVLLEVPQLLQAR